MKDGKRLVGRVRWGRLAGSGGGVGSIGSDGGERFFGRSWGGETFKEFFAPTLEEAKSVIESRDAERGDKEDLFAGREGHEDDVGADGENKLEKGDVATADGEGRAEGDEELNNKDHK